MLNLIVSVLGSHRERFKTYVFDSFCKLNLNSKAVENLLNSFRKNYNMNTSNKVCFCYAYTLNDCTQRDGMKIVCDTYQRGNPVKLGI